MHQEPPDEGQRDRSPQPTLPAESLPDRIVSFFLNDDRHTYPSSPRFAVVRGEKLTIFKRDGGKVVPEFSLQAPEPGPGSVWDEMESFPSPGLPGVVLWSTSEYTRDGATIVCYVNGKFQVVFEGHDVELLDIDLDGIPEIVTGFGPVNAYQQPEYSQVWTWDGSKYVRVMQVKFRQLFSADVVKALQAVRKNKKTK